MERTPASLESASRLREALGEALAGFEQSLARPAALTDWAEGVQDALVELRAAFRSHAAEVEGHDGLLEDLRREAPRVSGLVELLEDDHVTIDEALAHLGELLGDGAVDEVRKAGLDVMRRLVLHRQRGADVVFEAYVAEIGGRG